LGKERILTKSDRASAFFFLLLSLFICQQSLVIGVGTLSSPGSGLLSFGAGAGIGILALCLLVQSFLSKKIEEEMNDGGTFQKGRFLLVCFCLFGYAAVVNSLGFVLATFIFVLLVLTIIESQKWWLLMIKAALIAIGNYLFFVVWLGLSLPEGIFGW
jgi:putative tricarboxylic transport membrane protein